jgi:cyclopropane-fatty-acyl-phospholipid synthase
MNSETGSLAVDLPALPRMPWYQRRLVDQLRKLQLGCLYISLPGHPPFKLQGAAAGPTADISITRPGAVLWRLFWRGDLGFAEGYMAGEWDSDDPARLLELFSLNLDAYAETDARHSLARLLARLRHRLNRNSRRGSRRNIAAHYDLGNDFYAQWLDSSMTYSAALFDQGGSLVQAQERKYQRMLEQIDPKPGDHILEIGCGWGGYAEYAARRGMRVTGLTLSQEQLCFARRRIAAQGLDDQVELRLCDYRDFDEPVDHVVSIEMFEAVGQEYWQGYFSTLARCVRPGGRVALQVITIDETQFDHYAENPGGFIQSYIFPGGMLPTKAHLKRLSLDAGLRWRGMEGFGIDYADTLQVWHQRFNRCTNWLEAHGYDRRFRRMWRYYLAFCEAGFRARQIDVVHCVMEKG